jgi:hypothetical protein
MNITDYLQQVNQNARLKIEIEHNARLQRENELLKKFSNTQSEYIKQMHNYFKLVMK